MQQVVKLIIKDFTIDWRQQNPISGILLYLSTTIFSTYMAFRGFLQTEIWNALFWIILLFTAINAISKSFIQEERRSIYYYFLIKPHLIVLAKQIYSFLYLIVLAFVSLTLFSVLFGNPIQNFGLFALNLFLGCLGLSSAFTMVSAIAFNTSNRGIMMAVLGFPVIIPVLVLAIGIANGILEGQIWMQLQGNFFTLLSLDVVIIALSFVLFPFTWKS